MSRISLFAWILILTSNFVLAQEPSDEAMRKDAHKTILRRLSRSGGAQTSKLGLSPGATAFVDLYLDLHRNKDEIRRGRAPRSKYFHGTPHPEMKVEGEALCFSACFAVFKIDRAEVPLKEVPGLLEAALEKDFTTKVSVATDRKSALNAMRFGLISEVVNLCDPHLAKEAESKASWEALKKKTARVFLEGVNSVSQRDLYPVLNCLKRVGGDKAATALIEKMDGLPRGTRPWIRSMYASAVCGMGGEVSKKYAIKLLAGEDDTLKAAALSGLQQEPDDEVYGLIEKILAQKSSASSVVRSSAIPALERFKSPRAVKILEKAFLETVSAREKYSLACALTRLGNPAAIPYLKEKIEEAEKSEVPRKKARSAYLTRLLENFEKKK